MRQRFLRFIMRPGYLIAAAVLVLSAGLTAYPVENVKAAPVVTVDSLSITPTEPKPTDSVRATAVIRASSTFTVQALTIAVRDSAGRNYDFPGARNNVTLGTSQYTFTPDARTFPGGSYTYFVAYQYNNVWTELEPRKTFGSYTFRDEFETTAGPNYNLWRVDDCWSRDRCGNNELQQYSADNCWTDGNNLVLAAWKQSNPDYPYASCRLTLFDVNNNAKWSQKYGHFEARVLAPQGKGLFPAFWMEGANKATVGWPKDGEIDVFEALGQAPTIAEQHVHGQYSNGTYFKWGGHWNFPLGQDITGWHTYSVDWDAGGITWKIDGITVRRLNAADAGTAWSTSFQHPFTLIVNLAVGGNYPGSPDSSTVFPAYMKVAWIRAW